MLIDSTILAPFNVIYRVCLEFKFGLLARYKEVYIYVGLCCVGVIVSLVDLFGCRSINRTWALFWSC